MDLKGCPAADFPGVKYIGGGDGAVVFERLDEERNCSGERHGLFLVVAFAVSAKDVIRLDVQAPFQRSSRCGLCIDPSVARGGVPVVVRYGPGVGGGGLGWFR